MKYTVMILFCSLLQVSAASLGQTLTLKQHNITLEKVFTEIRKQTGYNVLLSAKQVNTQSKVDANFNHTALTEVLNKCLNEYNLTYTIEDKTIVVTAKESTIWDKAKSVLAIQITVTGKIQDELGDPMAGVTVKQKDRLVNAVITDKNGYYSLTVPDNNVFVQFSFIGYETQELQAKNIASGSVIILKASTTNLHEVVVDKGYYKERAELSAGNVAIVKAQEISEQPVADPIQALEGRVAGLNIQQTSGIPGSYAKIQIRGQNSIANGNDPLYVIDGVPFSSVSLASYGGVSTSLGVGGTFNNGSLGNTNGGGLSPFSAINPSDIETIEVLKDADATAIYGSRGANGVILITTKKGKPGATKFNLNAQTGVSKVAHFLDELNTQQYLEMRHEAFKNDGLTNTSPTYTTAYDLNGVWDTTRYTNWQKELIGGTAQFSNVQGSVSGGNSNTQFVLSGTYNHQTTVFPGDFGDTKFSPHLSLTHVSDNQKFHAQVTIDYVNDNDKVPQTDFTMAALTLAPDAPPLYNSNGSVNWQVYNGVATFNTNPMGAGQREGALITNNLITGANLSYEILPGLQIKSNLGFNKDDLTENVLIPAASYAPPNNTSAALRANYVTNTSFQTWIIEPQISYRKKISSGQLSILLGTSLQQTNQQQLNLTASNFNTDAQIVNPAAASSTVISYNLSSLYRYSGTYAQIGYNWEEKYILNLTGRRDGSSRFGPGDQFGNFGSVAGAWIFSKEKFIQDQLPWISFGKLRLSYGVTGNDQLGDYKYLSTYNVVSTTLYQGGIGLSPSGLTNPYFHWEKIEKLEGGMDLAFLKDRINLDLSYYRNRDLDELVGQPLSAVTGFSSIQSNFPAVVQNTGLEVNLNTVNLKTSQFTWQSTVNFTLPKNKLLSFPGIENSVYRSTYLVGQPLSIRLSPEFIGVNPQTGVYQYLTANANGKPTNPQEYVWSAPIIQKFYGGFQNSFSYKNFSLSIFIQGVKQNAYDYLKYFGSPGLAANLPTVYLSRWQNSGDVTNIAKFSTSSKNDPNTLITTSTAIISDASYLRLKNASLSYSLPQSLQKWAHMQNTKVFIQGENLLTVTNYIGLDPEDTNALSLPPLRTITLGLSAIF